jgi:hypothetical protein
MKAAFGSSRTVSVATLMLGGLLPFANATTVSKQFSGLLSNSPFGKPAVDPADTSVIVDKLEFRAVLEEKNGRYFSFFEVSPKRSTWVGMNERVNEILVREYDAGKMTIRVDYHGESLTLPLKGGKRLAWTAASTPTPAPRAAPAEDSSYHDRPFRIGHVSEEMEIRDAVRQRATPPTNGTDNPS